eukprot:1166397-Rhodomonas_salina.2
MACGGLGTACARSRSQETADDARARQRSPPWVGWDAASLQRTEHTTRPSKEFNLGTATCCRSCMVMAAKAKA